MTHPHDREQRARRALERRRAARAAQMRYPRARQQDMAGHILLALGCAAVVFVAVALLAGAGMPPALQVVALLSVACLGTAVWLWWAARRAETRYRLGLYARHLRLTPRPLPPAPPPRAVTATPTPARLPAVITTMPECRNAGMPDDPPPPTPTPVTLENVTAT